MNDQTVMAVRRRRPAVARGSLKASGRLSGRPVEDSLLVDDTHWDSPLIQLTQLRASSQVDTTPDAGWRTHGCAG